MLRLGFLTLLLAGCATAPPADRAANSILVDHVIVGAGDLDKAITDLEKLTGVRSIIGGVHPGRGTRNALMSLGDGTYLEILAPDPAQSIDNEEIRELRALTSPTPVGWAVSAGDESALRTALATAGIATSAPVPGSRAKPDGSILRWVTFGYDDVESPFAPFFIVWADPALHPSRTSPGGCRLSTIRVQSAQADGLARAIAPLRLGVSVDAAPDEQMQLSLACPKGDVRL